jgi:DNA-binding response OmpR family regulator
MNMDEPRVLVVEDEIITRQLVEAYLTQAGFRVSAVSSGEAALARLGGGVFDVVVTDLSLSGIDGIAVMAAARAANPDSEVIVLTGAATLESAIAAIQHGAFAYIRKPARPGELEQAVRAALARRRERQAQATIMDQLGKLARLAETRAEPYSTMRATPSAESELLRVGGLAIDTQRYLVTRDSLALQLSPGEFALLAYLARRPEQVISPRQLARDVLGYDCSPHEARELVKARVHKLRQKIEPNPAAPQLLRSVRGIGYVLTAGRPG